MAVQMSPDGGVTWTSALVDSREATREATAALGGPTETWGANLAGKRAVPCELPRPDHDEQRSLDSGLLPRLGSCHGVLYRDIGDSTGAPRPCPASCYASPGQPRRQLGARLPHVRSADTESRPPNRAPPPARRAPPGAQSRRIPAAWCLDRYPEVGRGDLSADFEAAPNATDRLTDLRYSGWDRVGCGSPWRCRREGRCCRAHRHRTAGRCGHRGPCWRPARHAMSPAWTCRGTSQSRQTTPSWSTVT